MSFNIISDSFALPAGISRAFLLRHRVCPAGRDESRRLIVARTSSGCGAAVEELGEFLKETVLEKIVDEDDLERLIERCVNETDRLLDIERVDERTAEQDRTADVRDLANQPPVIRYVNLLLRDAVDAGASDVHLEATRDSLDVRFRIDGMLIPAIEPPSGMQHAVISRLKTIAELDIAERRRPQDGRIRIRLANQELDLRLSTVPTTHGESLVLRLLHRTDVPIKLGALGLPPELGESLASLVSRPHGLLLVTGPTGSGKTTTLYAALQERDVAREKIITVEDPVEFQLSGITQVPVARQAGVTFASALRAILRQDPDVLLIGEMRDRETAEVAVQAAMTGHLVLSTLHTNDAISAIPRLLDLGVADYLVGATLDAVLAQRLVRRLCDACAVPAQLSAEAASRVAGRPVGRAEVRSAVGCPECRFTGYRRRTGIYELVKITDGMRALIAGGVRGEALYEQARQDGTKTLREHGWELVTSGVTSADEVQRVTQD